MALTTPTTGRISLAIDGVAVPGLKQFSGLGAEGVVVQNNSGPGGLPKKHMAGFKWTPGRGSTSIALGKGLYGWVKAALAAGLAGAGTAAARDGAFKSADANGKVQAGRAFSNAVLTEFSVPALDASSRDAGLFDFAFEADRVSWSGATGEAIGPLGPVPKSWLKSNFKVSIGDLPCARVAQVDAFTWRCAAAARATVPDLCLHISAVDYPAWQAAARKWFIDGGSLEANEMQGRISLLGATLKDSDELGAIELYNVGFKRFDHEAATPGTEQVARFTVVLYVERMALSIKAYEA